MLICLNSFHLTFISCSIAKTVVGGPAGCTVASKLAATPKAPSVLLLEAGGKNDDQNQRVEGLRFITLAQKHMNWGYKTANQEGCNDRQLDYSRGLGIGGCSAINFSVYTVGSRAEYDEWAKIAGDQDFSWDRMQPRFKKLETFHAGFPSSVENRYQEYAAKAIDHGASGPLHLGYATEWDKHVVSSLDFFKKAGFPLNPDHNSGNPTGTSVVINSSYKAFRTTSGDMLASAPGNLTVITDSPVQRVILDGKRAVGIESNGKRCRLYSFNLN